MFDLTRTVFFHDLIIKLARGIPDKPKLIMTYNWGTGREVLPETLLATCSRFVSELSIKSLTSIFKKRWQSQTLSSMANELKRSGYRKYGRVPIVITDTLSSLLRFKREEELSSLQLQL